MATGGIAALAGGDPATSLRLGLSMLCMQVSIGAVNDVVDAPLDRLEKPAKPIAAGLVSERTVGVWGALAAVMGLVLAAPSGLATLAVWVAAVGLGYLYDLSLSRTAWSWLPLTLALPLLPLFAWLGATGTVPPELAVLVVAAALAGLGLIVGNGLVDFDRDAAAGKGTVAVRVGRRRAWAAHAGALALAVLVIVLASPDGAAARALLTTSSPLAPSLPALLSLGIPLGASAIALGAGLLAARSAAVRERGWELEVLGTAVVGLAWLARAAA